MTQKLQNDLHTLLSHSKKAMLPTYKTVLNERGRVMNILNTLLHHIHSGKVRETYEIPAYPDFLLQFATDRISTHNVVHKSLIPNKGSILTAMTVHWLREVFGDMEHHLVASGREIYKYLPSEIRSTCPELHHRAIIVRRLRMAPRELIFRSYLVEAGSLYKAYKAGEDPYELKLPDGLPIMYRFSPPIFTPTEKSDTDDPLSHLLVQGVYPREVAAFEKAYMRAGPYLEDRGIALLDSKGECGIGGVLADELFTPDSSRFANIDDIEEGKDPPWLDKEFGRQEAVRVWNGGDKTPLIFSTEAIDHMALAYGDIMHRTSSHTLTEWWKNNLLDFHI